MSAYYDPAGRLENYASTSGGTFAYDHDGPNLASEYAMPGGARVKRYVWGPEPDELLVEYSGTNLATRTWSLQDERGSVVARADDTGTVTTTLSYDEYGTPAASNTGRFQYTGQAWLPELDLHHYKARMCAPGVGRFMQTDPIGYDDGINWYAYVGGDPVNGIDLDGKESGSVSFKSVLSMTAAAEERGLSNEQPFVQQTMGAVRDFVENYQAMREEDRIGNDKEFHCRANCEASTRGRAGEATARGISNARENSDDIRKGSNPKDRRADEAANKRGQDGGRDHREARQSSIKPREAEKICKSICKPLAPRKTGRD